MSLFVAGRYAYVGDAFSDDLKVIDISDSSSPSIVGSGGYGSYRSFFVAGRYE